MSTSPANFVADRISKMLQEISNGGTSTIEKKTYADLRFHAGNGLSTLRNPVTKFYRASSINCFKVDHIWATALAISEDLISNTKEKLESAEALKNSYLKGDITQRGFIRHLPKNQY